MDDFSNRFQIELSPPTYSIKDELFAAAADACHKLDLCELI